MDVRLVRTKTGNKIHLAGRGSSRTFCGARVAGPVKKVPANALPCQGCGLPPEMTAETMEQWMKPSTNHATKNRFRVFKREGQQKMPAKASFDRQAEATAFAKKWAAEQRSAGYSTGQIVIAGPMAFGEQVIWLGEVPQKRPARPARFHAAKKTPMRLEQEIAALTARSQSRSRAPAPKGPFGIYARSFDGYENYWQYLLGPFKTKRGAEREAKNFRGVPNEIIVLPISQGGRR